jgi:tRNA(Arg) A34 adenosine deaminase TadA
MTNFDDFAMARVLELSNQNISLGGRPFGCVISQNEAVIAEATNTSHLSLDPTDHSEIACIKKACAELGIPSLEGCTVYAMVFPCPMCLAAIVLSKASRLCYGTSLAEKDVAFRDDYSTRDLYLELYTASNSVELEQIIPFSNLKLSRIESFGSLGAETLSRWIDQR